MKDSVLFVLTLLIISLTSSCKKDEQLPPLPIFSVDPKIDVSYNFEWTEFLITLNPNITTKTEEAIPDNVLFKLSYSVNIGYHLLDGTEVIHRDTLRYVVTDLDSPIFSQSYFLDYEYQLHEIFMEGIVDLTVGYVINSSSKVYSGSDVWGALIN